MIFTNKSCLLNSRLAIGLIRLALIIRYTVRPTRRGIGSALHRIFRTLTIELFLALAEMFAYG